jgi:iron complex outermembrane recepter protein
MREARTLKVGTALATVLAGLTAAAPACAQSAEQKPVAYEEIVVTATRRAQALSDVPLSIAAFDQAIFDKKGAKSIEDMVRMTPGLSFQPDNGGFTQQIAIRGIKSSVGAQTTGIYIDGTPIQVRSLGVATTNFYPTLFDLERVEVLRGPQGTLFGAGAQGGAIRFITPQPSFDGEMDVYARGGVQVTEGGGVGYEVGAAFGGPISENVAFRVSGYTRRDAGYVDQINRFSGDIVDKNINSQQRTALRAALAFRLSEELTVTPSFFMEIDKADDRGFFWESYSDPKKGRFLSAWNKQPFKDEVYLPALNIEWKGEAVDIISETSYFRRNFRRSLDFSTYTPQFFGIPLAPFDYQSESIITPKQRQFTQELRVQSANPDARLKWVFGAFYQRSPFSNLQLVVDPQLPALTTSQGWTMLNFWGSNLIGDLSFSGDTSALDKQLAGFGQIDYEIVDGLTATVGARYSKTKFSFTNIGRGPLSNGATTSGKSSETPFTPKFALSYKPGAGDLVYASASKGYRIGGANRTGLPPVANCLANLQQLGYDSVPPTFKSDTLWTYELGTKNSFADGRVRVELTGFYSRWKDIQRNVSLSACGGSFIGNAGEAVSKGFDFSVGAQLSDSFSLNLAGGYTDAKLDETIFGSRNTSTTPPTPRTIVSKGDSLGVPAFTLSAGAQYDGTLMGRDVYVRADYAYTSKVSGLTPGRNPANVLVYDPDLVRDDAVNLVSLRTGMKIGDADVSVFVDNLLDEAPTISRYHEAIGIDAFFQTTVRPRTFGLTVTYRR